MGTLKDVKVKLHVQPAAQPRFCQPRLVPYALRDKVVQELERLEQSGVIEPVQFSEWAAPIVPVVKQDTSVRICGDFKMTVNQVALRDVYPLSRVEDLLANHW